MVFCNKVKANPIILKNGVTILILVDGFLQSDKFDKYASAGSVTILILVDGFLQYFYRYNVQDGSNGHNPYFSRWFSAIVIATIHQSKPVTVTILILVDGFLQYVLQLLKVIVMYVSQSLF